ncbi:peptidoglycan DD-metalloendopeptidase family protein [Microbacterium sp. KUDC0406]|uniref:M23 family metallopeptidase n=1 Tax=Microbacterium sp. KUDC0406 TaxID=2909588 RepID=UPI001F2C58DA|nr:M23 family metallopeptidase [Microbacterium sp. KUDC0406]UJP09138.1 peptidoglycan DD-metalloendopeptidase family protein [Microbacterium sp. KUDC0406]
MNDEKYPVEAGEPDCGCGPTPGERSRLWTPDGVTRRSAMTIGALSVAALGVFGIGAGTTAAFAASYPSWDDVQKAKANQAAKAGEVTRIKGLIQSLTNKVAETKAASEKAGDEFFVAQQKFFDAAQQADDLQSQADEQAKLADETSAKAGQVATQLYRKGGEDSALELFFSGSAANADGLLSRLGTMDKLLEYNQSVYDNAVAARNSAQALSNKAKVARDERDRLQKVAEQKMIAAQQAADAAQAALDESEANLTTLQAQLAALQDTTAKTVAAYQEGERIRKAAEEKRRREEAARRAREAAEAAKNNGGGGGGGGGGGTPTSSGWVRPHGGHRSSGYGARPRPCPSCSAFHYGVDLANGCGAPIYAAHSGTVDAAFYNGGYGNYIRIQHGGGIGTGYGHIRPGGFRVSPGQHVRAGQVIAYAGTTGASTGCHLHFEVYRNGGAINPITFMAAHGISV